MRNELTEKIIMMLCSRGIVIPDIAQDLTIILNDYEIQTRETALAIRNEDKNRYYLQKFLIAKTVQGCTERTIVLYHREISRILEMINKSVDEITTDDIRLYLAYRHKRDKVTKTTINNERRYLSTFFNYLVVEEILTKNPVLKIGKVKREKTKKEAFTEMEVEKIRYACRTSMETLIVELLLSTGCRVTELVNIKIADIENDELIVHGKGEKDRIVYLNARTVMALGNYLKERKDRNEYLFPAGVQGFLMTSGKPMKDKIEWHKNPEWIQKEGHIDMATIEQKLKKMGRKLGIRVHPHKFRRTCATFALRRGMPIEQVSKMLGHEEISSTQIYLDLSEEDLKQAHKKYVV